MKRKVIRRIGDNWWWVNRTYKLVNEEVERKLKWWEKLLYIGIHQSRIPVEY